MRRALAGATSPCPRPQAKDHRHRLPARRRHLRLRLMIIEGGAGRGGAARAKRRSALTGAGSEVCSFALCAGAGRVAAAGAGRVAAAAGCFSGRWGAGACAAWVSSSMIAVARSGCCCWAWGRCRWFLGLRSRTPITRLVHLRLVESGYLLRAQYAALRHAAAVLRRLNLCGSGICPLPSRAASEQADPLGTLVTHCADWSDKTSSATTRLQ